MLEYYEYDVVGEYAEGMTGAIVTAGAYPAIHREFFSLGGKLVLDLQ